MLSEFYSLNLKLSSQKNKKFFCTWLWCHIYAVVGDQTTQIKQVKWAMPMGSLCILLCLRSRGMIYASRKNSFMRKYKCTI